MSSLAPGHESNAGLSYLLLREAGESAHLTVHYEAGVQWRDWSASLDVAAGRGIDRQIERAYGVLAARYRPGDRIFLMGFSRGAYAVRWLAGVIDRVGLVRADQATVRTIRQACRHHRAGACGPVAEAFRGQVCHDRVTIEAVGVWDTVRSLGLRLPGLGTWIESGPRFRSSAPCACVKHNLHALALDETRDAYAPVMWRGPHGVPGHLEQVWFRGTHGDVGGQLEGYAPARPLANVPLVWMLARLEEIGLPLPGDWRGRFPCDPAAPSLGLWRGWSKLMVSRHPRDSLRDPSERLHETARRRSFAGVGAPART
jgi:uncharacterized protein (DUF2235 family)